MRRVTVRRSADGGGLEVRAGDRVLGQVSRLQSVSETEMTGSFAHSPAYADFASEMLKLLRAKAAGNGDEVARLRTALEAAGVQVWHTSHDMRIDRPQTLDIADGKVSFTPNDSFLMMRTGGL
ncbi:MAG: hypothetical protein ACK5JT_04510 [Hyphomicrobiaceae bacterium]